MIHVLYHANCRDGFGAAWAIHRHFSDIYRSTPDYIPHACNYIPVQYGDPVPDDLDDSDLVYIVDFSYDRETLARIADQSRRVLVIDHHKTAKEALEGFEHPALEIVFDMEKSGAVLTWEYFHPDKPVPKLLQYIQDCDLWTWKLAWTREINAYLETVPFDFAKWDEVAIGLDEPQTDASLTQKTNARLTMIDIGGGILDYKQRLVESLAAKAMSCVIGGYLVPCVNSPLFQSEIGEKLCEMHPEAPFVACYFVTGEGNWVYSLRSRNGFDVSEVAKQYGGGGHQAAAGYSVAKRVL